MTGGGTGFHYANRRIITISHVVRKDEKDEYASNLFELWVKLLAATVFRPKKRLCFFANICFGPKADSDNPHVVIFLLTGDEM